MDLLDGPFDNDNLSLFLDDYMFELANATPSVPTAFADRLLASCAAQASGSAFQAQAQPQKAATDSATTSKDSGDREDTSTKQKAGSKDDVKALRLQKLAEKNRRAQKKFRERQKAKVVDLETRVQQLTEQLAAMRTDMAAVQNQNAVLQQVLTMRESQLETIQKSNAASKQDSVNGSAAVDASAACDALLSYRNPQYTPEIIKSMTADDVIMAWQRGVSDMASALIIAEQPDPPQAALQRVHQAVVSVGEMCSKVALLTPLNIRRLLACDINTRQPARAELRTDRQRYADILRSLKLTDDQVSQIRQLRALFMSQIGPIRQQRAVINASLLRELQRLPAGARAAGELDFKIAVHTLMDELKANLKREGDAYIALVIPMFSKVLTALQFARLCVRAYPYYPDGSTLADVVAATYGSAELAATSSASTQALAVATALQQIVNGCEPSPTASTVAQLAQNIAAIQGIQLQNGNMLNAPPP